MATLPPVKAVEDPTDADWFNVARTAIADVDAEVSILTAQSSIKNSNFEIDDGGGEPTNWTFVDVGGGSHALNTSTELSGAQSIKLTTTAADPSTVSMLSDKVKGGNLAVDLSFQMRRTDTCQDLEIRLMEYDTAGTLINSPGLLIGTIVGAASGLGTDVTPVILNGLVGLGTQYAVQFILGKAGTGRAGSIDIDSVIVNTRADIISKTEFSSYGDGATDLDGNGWIFIPAGITQVDTDVFINVMSGSSGTARPLVTINAVTSLSTATLTTQGDSSISTASVDVSSFSGSLPGVFPYKLSGLLAARMHQTKTLFQGDSGLKTGLVYT